MTIIRQPLHQSHDKLALPPSHPDPLSWKEPKYCYHKQVDSKRRYLQCHSSPLLILLTLFLLLNATTPVEAKSAFTRKVSDSTTSTQQGHQKKPKRTETTKVRTEPKIILQPRPNHKRTITVRQQKTPEKATTESQPISLEATLTKNNSGEHVLILTPESADSVRLAVKKESVAKQAAPVHQATQVLFYDPEELPETEAGEPPVAPNKVYDAEGREVTLHDGEEMDLILPPKPPKPSVNEFDGSSTQSDGSSTQSDSTSTQSDASSSNKSNKIRLHIRNPQTQDQMIIISTVATMALLIGALSARRLRSRQFLSFCIENESLEDDMAFDAAYTTQSTVGDSSLYGGYDTFGDGERYGGDLRWRGDLEKFDV